MGTSTGQVTRVLPMNLLCVWPGTFFGSYKLVPRYCLSFHPGSKETTASCLCDLVMPAGEWETMWRKGMGWQAAAVARGSEKAVQGKPDPAELPRNPVKESCSWTQPKLTPESGASKIGTVVMLVSQVGTNLIRALWLSFCTFNFSMISCYSASRLATWSSPHNFLLFLYNTFVNNEYIMNMQLDEFPQV